MDALISYMFPTDAVGRPDAFACAKLWFRKSGAIDRDIRTRFGQHVQRAVEGGYDAWLSSPRGCVALMILVDQFPRNIYRNTSAMFCGQEVSGRILQQPHSWESLPPLHQLFVPELILTHQEDVAAQRQCVEWFERLRNELPPKFQCFQRIFEKHLAVIERFGHFPHRNSLLGRPTTDEERNFLLDAENRFDLAARLNPTTGELEFGRHPDALWRLLEDEVRAAAAVERDLDSKDQESVGAGRDISAELDDEYRDIFGELDADGTGRLSARELASLFDRLHKPYAMQKLEALVSHLCRGLAGNCDTGLTFRQFVALMEADLAQEDAELSFDELYSLFNNGAGSEISVEAFYACIHMISPKITNSEIAAMLKRLGCAPTDTISRDDFHRIAIELHGAGDRPKARA